MWSPASYQLCALTAQPPEILHGHNLHGLYGYFDLGALPLLARQLPVVLTLHDAWLVSGHCAHSLGCERWRTGCGRCPDLTLHPPLLRDGTARNWLCKAAIFARCQLYVATPSRGLMEQVERSLLAPALAGTRVIPNGVDTATFCPADPRAARRELNLRDDADIVLFAANGIRRNPWKDYRTLWAVLERLGARRQKPLLLLALGETAPAQRQGNAELRFLPFEADARVVARYFQAADVYLHCTRADTFPTTVLEALACGTPVVAAGVGGIPEQILEGQTGCLTAARDAEGMAAHVERLLSDRRLRDSMSRAARSCAEQRFGRDRMVRDYLDWYAEILASRRLRPAANEGQGKCASRL
jgi:glycosyltransferase involved in cell wall biosynthesis